MQKLSIFLFISTVTLFMVSCKNEVKTETLENTKTEVAKKPEGKRAKKKELTQEDVKELNSVMYRVMTTPELKKYASYIVTAGLADMLSTGKGPFMVFAPSNIALEALTAEKKKFYATPENKAKLEQMLKSNIVEGAMNSETLMQAINKNGTVSLKSLGGINLTATKSGENIIIADGKGAKVKILKGSIEGSNGVLYVVDGVMNAN